MSPAISIVVPIFNMEAYLPRCLDSLLHQTFRDIEIIAVNDGSTDGSLKVLESYSERDSRLKIIDSDNQGVSGARNLGLSYCTGQYIGFVDPDDWVSSTMYEQMLDAALDQDIDIVMCAYTREFGTHTKPKHYSLPDKSIYHGEEVQWQLTRRLIGPLGVEVASPEQLDAWGTVWSKLYKRSLIRKAGCSFIDLKEIGSNEDTLFNIEAFSHAESFIFLNRPLYHYWRANTESITTCYKPLLDQQFQTLYQCMELFAKGRSVEYRQALNNRIALNVLGLGLNIVSTSNPASVFGKVSQIKQLLSQRVFGDALAKFEIRNCTSVWRLFYTAAKWRLAWPVYLLLMVIDMMRTKSIRRNRSGIYSYPAGRDYHESRRTRDDANELLSANEQKRLSV
ncbi:glycosyltransferase [Paenibacillus sp. PL2-23]|uniref:glycosyltransferase n=1 Tax=Paenibacillus sp. PL2-23 TaxID=2100729 RepID=UPI0030FB4ABC